MDKQYGYINFFMLVVLRFILCFAFISIGNNVDAEEILDSKYLHAIANDVNKAPWATYQKILLLENSLSENVTADNKLWLLLRKAQAENLLYFYSEFNKTVTDAQALVNAGTSIELKISFNIYSGLIFQRKSEYQKSANILTIALEEAQSHHFNFLVVKAKQELAYTRSLAGLYESSLTDLQQAYVEAVALNDNFLIAIIHEVYGAVYGYMQDYEKSIKYYKQALIDYKKLEYPAHIAEAINGLAATYRYWKKYELSIEHYKLYQQSVSYSPNKDIIFYAAYGLGMAIAEKGDCKQALVMIDKALGLHGLKDYNAELYKRKTQCLIKLNRLDEAKEALGMAMAIFDEIPELKGTRWQLEVIKIEAELAHASGNSELSYRLNNSYYQSYTALLLKNSSERLLRVRAALEFSKKDTEIQLLQQREKVHLLESFQQKQENKQQSYIILFFILLAVFIIIILIAQRQNNKKLLALSVRDSLSNLYNRRYVFNFLTKLINTTDAQKGDISIMLIDIDEFKQINDQYGHPFGDEVIREIARIGENTLRVEDVMGRIGGEEFLCVLPRIGANQCLQIAQRFVDNINKHTFITKDKKEVKVTVSIGISSTSKNINKTNMLYLYADKALYHSKYNGKNMVSQYHDYMNNSFQNDLNLDEFN